MSFAQWKKLLYGIERGECTLFVGPELPMTSAGGESRVPARALASRLLEGLDDLELDAADPLAVNLAWLSQRYVSQEDEVGLEMELGQWHEKLRDETSTLHDDLAALPFRFIVTSGHDPLMEAALRRAGKTPAVERYHFRGKNKDLLPEPTAAAPVLFHLYGHVGEPSSVVLTETQLLEFLAKLIAGDPPLPNDLNAMLTNGRIFLFLGFGLEQWYLRILLHVLKVLRRGSRSFAVEALEASRGTEFENAILFYRENFKMDVFPSDVGEFVHELRGHYVPPPTAEGAREAAPSAAPLAAEPASAATGSKVFICHASEDAGTARRIHDALKRAGLEPWLDKESLRGGDLWDDHIESTIREVDYFVVLNSRALDAKSRAVSYVNKEIKKALEAEDLRLMGGFIIPVTVDETPLLKPLAKYHAIDLAADGPRALVRAIKRQIDAA